MTDIPDWPKFVIGTHFYMLATAGGNGERGDFPIHDAIRRSKLRAYNLATSDFEANVIMTTDDHGWVDSLSVYIPAYEAAGMYHAWDEEVARYDLHTKQWVEVHDD